MSQYDRSEPKGDIAGRDTDTATNTMSGDSPEHIKPKSKLPVRTTAINLRKSLSEDSGINQVQTSEADLVSPNDCPSPTCRPQDMLAAHHSACGLIGKVTDSQEYLTPLQRKEQSIKELKSKVKQLAKSLEDKQREIADLDERKTAEVCEVTGAQQRELDLWKTKCEGLETKYDQLTTSYEESVKAITDLEDAVKSLRDDLGVKTAESQELYLKSQELYLEMYKKGQESAKFERQDELEQLAMDDIRKITTRELLEKLVSTEVQLERWQSFRCQESYDDSSRPSTDAETKLLFIKDAMYHYLTDKKDAPQHLRAMIQIFGYTDIQLKAITRVMLGEKEKRSDNCKGKTPKASDTTQKGLP